ncbi:MULTISPECIES: cytochrome-c peroxidase [Halomonas]|uniref:Methylamine utilization protein MauG n=1 Tax=Halomonas ventosae TaxID=229007 RepID=A0A4V3C1R5_9GAMM|nr:cytochrome-c peroxidase [Halomonas ventosae]TDO15299.1 cytochrome c peroxidase [Halomonas ventosae]
MKAIQPTRGRLLAAAAALLVAGNAAAYDWQALPEKPPSPKHNPTTEAKVELGKKLYFDPRYSASGTVSCNTCHNLMEGSDDGRPTSMGVFGRTGPRNAPPVWNAAFMSTQFWDGRAKNLEEQAKGPITAGVEMGMGSMDMAVERVISIDGYRELFAKAFPGDSNPTTVDNFVKAVAAFERTLITPNSPYDQYVKGDKSALSDQQVRGMKTFNEVGCTSCHSGPAFNGPQMNMPEGQGFYQKFPTFTDNEYVKKYNLMADKGRARGTGKESDLHMYKVPTLRNVTLTAPYFHNGQVETLPEAVRVMGKVQLNKDLSKQQVTDIVAFLNGLTGEFPEITMPRLPSNPGETVVEVSGDAESVSAH